MANLDFLDAKHPVFVKNDEAWAREERRLYGGGAVLDELVQWRNEPLEKYEQRRAQAPWIGLGKTHAMTIAGHVIGAMPIPNYGTMGDVRERKEINGPPSVAELFHYNCDGVGSDGTQLPAFAAGVIQRGMATGDRWTLVEMPRRATDGPVTQADVLAGQRPYLVEYSPRSVPMWEYTDGRLDWAVIRTPVGVSGVKDGRWEPAPTANGYYLLVRQGYQGLGPDFSSGGWWLFDADKKEHGTGDWSRTRGQIPLVRFVAESSTGTLDWPARARLMLKELGQIDAALMNRISERDYNLSDSAKSVKYVLGAAKDAFNLMVEHHEANSILVPVIGEMTPDGKFTIPSIWSSADGAIDAQAFQVAIDSHLAFAREIMVRMVTSTPDSSGESKRAGFGEATAPLLATVAANVETWLNTVIYFAELRAGAATPSGFATLPREFELAPIIQKIDRNLERLQKAAARSPTLEASMLEAAARDDGLWPKGDADGKTASEELRQSLAFARRKEQAAVFDTFAKSGSVAGAAKLAELTSGEARALSDVDVSGEGDGTDNGSGNGNGAGRGVPVLTQ